MTYINAVSGGSVRKAARRCKPGGLRSATLLSLVFSFALLAGLAPGAAQAQGSVPGSPPAPVLGDLNGDGRDDVLLRHTDGRWYYYPMNGRRFLTDERGYAGLTRNLDWHVAGIGDLNGDGRDDVLLRHTDGRWDYYPMDGRNPIADQRGLAGLAGNLDWQVAGIGDLNGDGRDDVLLRHTDGRWDYYPMDGRNPIADQRGLAGLAGNLDWQVAGIGDLNGDGRDDVLLRHTDGRWDYYPMDGRNPIADQRGLAGLAGNLDWQVAGIGDLNGDGRDDVLLRHTDGRWDYYPMDGRNPIADQRGLAGLTRNLDWQVAGIGDLNGDGRDDVLLRHTDSRWYYYPMDGRRFLTDARGYANLTRNPDWSVAAADTLAPEDTAPSFGTAGVVDQNYVAGAAIDALTLPAAGGGNGALTYSLTPDVPGLSFDATTHRLTGTPASADTYNMTYTVTDEDGDTDTLSFAITVNPDSSGTSTISRTEFEAAAPTGYTSVTLGDSGSVWGVPVKYTSDSNSGTVAYMLLGTMKGCTFANAEADRSSRAYIKTQELGSLSNYESAIVCRKTSSTWNSFAGTRMTHLRVFDESSPTNIREYVYDAVTGLYDETTSPAPEGGGGSATRHTVGDVVTTLPTGSWVPDVTSGGSFSLSGGNSVLNLRNGGYIEEGGSRYTCESTGGCEVRNREVLVGTIVETPSGGGTPSPSDDHGDTRTGASPLALNASTSGRIESGSDVDYFNVQVSEPGTLTVYTMGSLDTTGELQSGSGSALASNDDGGSGRNFRIEREVSSGTYYIKVESFGSNTGSYTLHAEFSASGGGAGAPDLVVESPSVSDSTLNTGDSFTLNATVRNRGTGRSDATTLRYYRSSNSTISSSDTQAGTDAVGGLAASGSDDESTTLTAPSSAGTYYYGACVESVSGESDTGNNCSTGVRVTVSSSGGGGGGGACTAGLVVNPGESCTYKGNTFSVSASGRGSIAFFSAGSSIDARGSTINGVSWNFYASKNSGSNSWTIHDAD